MDSPVTVQTSYRVGPAKTTENWVLQGLEFEQSASLVVRRDIVSMNEQISSHPRLAMFKYTDSPLLITLFLQLGIQLVIDFNSFLCPSKYIKHRSS